MQPHWLTGPPRILELSSEINDRSTDVQRTICQFLAYGK